MGLEGGQWRQRRRTSPSVCHRLRATLAIMYHESIEEECSHYSGDLELARPQALDATVRDLSGKVVQCKKG